MTRSQSRGRSAVAFALCLAARVAHAEAPAAEPAAPPPLLGQPPAEPLPGAKAPPRLPPPPPPRLRQQRRKGTSALEPSPKAAAAPARSTEHVHDGFYLRLGAGPGYGRLRVQTDLVSQPDVSVEGVAGSVEIWVGGTLASGISMGGFLGGTGLRASEGDVGDDATAQASGSSTLFGIFFDAFPNPTEGYHFGGLLGLASVEVETDAEDGVAATKFSGSGLGLGVFAGVDTWIAKQWSFGVALRLFGSVTVEESSPSGVDLTKQGTSYAATALVSVLCH